MSEAIIEQKDGKYLITISHVGNTFVVDRIITPQEERLGISDEETKDSIKDFKKKYSKLFKEED